MPTLKNKSRAKSGDGMSVINASTQIDLVSVDSLQEHPRNPNQGDVAAIESSINENGFYGAVVAQKATGYILAGNHRYRAAKQAGASTIPVIWLDVDDRQATKILLADNRTAELAHRDEESLAKILQELAAEDDLLGTGYSGGDLDELLKNLGQMMDPFFAGAGEATGNAYIRPADRFAKDMNCFEVLVPLDETQDFRKRMMDLAAEYPKVRIRQR